MYLLLYLFLGTGLWLFLRIYANVTAYSKPVTSRFLEEWKILNIYDGDTIKVEKGGITEKLRLCGIDAPEISQPLGKKSRDYLRSLISHSNKISISISDTDRYGRKIAEVFVIDGNNEKFLNEELVKSGLAYHYTQYSKNCPNRIALENAEAIAKFKNLGVWNGFHTTPWEYRKAKRKKVSRE